MKTLFTIAIATVVFASTVHAAKVVAPSCSLRVAQTEAGKVFKATPGFYVAGDRISFRASTSWEIDERAVLQDLTYLRPNEVESRRRLNLVLKELRSNPDLRIYKVSVHKIGARGNTQTFYSVRLLNKSAGCEVAVIQIN